MAAVRRFRTSMKRSGLLIATVVLVAGVAFAAHHEFSYQKVASAHALMDYVVKPVNGKLGAIRKAGGPADDGQWKSVHEHAAVLAEVGQLLQLGGRVKDDVWAANAAKLVDGAQAQMKAAMAKDTEAWMAAAKMTGGSCAGCHKVHKPKKK